MTISTTTAPGAASAGNTHVQDVIGKDGRLLSREEAIATHARIAALPSTSKWRAGIAVEVPPTVRGIDSETKIIAWTPAYPEFMDARIAGEALAELIPDAVSMYIDMVD